MMRYAHQISDRTAVGDFVQYCHDKSVKALAEKNELGPSSQMIVLLRGAKLLHNYMKERNKAYNEEERKRRRSGRVDATMPDDPPRGVWVE